MRLTVSMLRAGSACAGEIDDFRKTFDDAVDVTEATVRRAAAAGLDLEWFIAQYGSDSPNGTVASYAHERDLMITEFSILINAAIEKQATDTMRLTRTLSAKYGTTRDELDVSYALRAAADFDERQAEWAMRQAEETD